MSRMDMISAKGVAERWSVTSRFVQMLCKNAQTEPTDEPEKSGRTSAVGGNGAILLISLVALGAAWLRKKRAVE